LEFYLEFIEAKSGKKLNPGEFVYVKRIFKSHRIGMVIRFFGYISSFETEEKQEIYEVLIGKKISLYNETLLDKIDENIIKNIYTEGKN
jgi:hypothetical protein